METKSVKSRTHDERREDKRATASRMREREHCRLEQKRAARGSRVVLNSLWEPRRPNFPDEWNIEEFLIPLIDE